MGENTAKIILMRCVVLFFSYLEPLTDVYFYFAIYGESRQKNSIKIEQHCINVGFFMM